MISNQAIEQAAYDIMAKAAIDIPEDYLGGIKEMVTTEKAQLSCFVLQSMVENWEVATEDRRPMCADTGLPRYYVKVGNDARIEGGFVAIERALRSATARATRRRRPCNSSSSSPGWAARGRYADQRGPPIWAPTCLR